MNCFIFFVDFFLAVFAIVAHHDDRENSLLKTVFS